MSTNADDLHPSSVVLTPMDRRVEAALDAFCRNADGSRIQLDSQPAISFQNQLRRMAAAIEALDATSDPRVAEIAALKEQVQDLTFDLKHENAVADRALGILHHMALERKGFWSQLFGRRWFIAAEPLRNDAANFLREIGDVQVKPEGTQYVGDETL